MLPRLLVSDATSNNIPPSQVDWPKANWSTSYIVKSLQIATMNHVLSEIAKLTVSYEYTNPELLKRSNFSINL